VRPVCLAPGCRKPVGERCLYYCGPDCRRRVDRLERGVCNGSFERRRIAYLDRKEQIARLLAAVGEVGA